MSKPKNGFDERFESVKRDHRFRPIKRSQKKIQVDERFSDLFNNKRFKLNTVTDKRGRPVINKAAKNLKRYYYKFNESNKKKRTERLDERKALSKTLDKNENHNVEVRENQSTVKNDENIDVQDEVNSDSDSSYTSSDSEIDFARGRGNIESSSEEDDDSPDENLAQEAEEPYWGELDNDAARSDDVSCRLALCNMDWDRVRAADLFILFDSFKPQSGSIVSVSIYPSEFGKQRMAEEEKMGPAELKDLRGNLDDDEVAQSEGAFKEEEDYNMQKLREYQINRLKYYYAVIVCDSLSTADHIYQKCDGLELETSASKIDLRFIPEDMSFEDDEAKERSSSIPDKLTYKPLSFTTEALNQTKVRITWDETDHKRTAYTKRKFKKEDLEDMDVRDFLASSSGSDSDENQAARNSLSKPTLSLETASNMTESERVASYRKLLLGEMDNDEKNDVDMEVIWEPDLGKVSEEGTEDLKVLESKKKKDQEDSQDYEIEDEEEKKELELMLQRDFTAKESDKESSDEFEIDVNDERFSALYTSSQYSIDHSSSKYRKSDAMEKIVKERHARSNRTQETINPVISSKEKIDEDSLEKLVKSIKKKSSSLFQKKS